MKKVFPALWFSLLISLLMISIFSGVYQKAPFILFPPIFVLFIGYFLMKKLVWDIVDEVYDHGDYLLIKNKGEEVQVYLSNVMNVNASTAFHQNHYN